MQALDITTHYRSMGVLLYFLLTGKQPFLGSSPQETANLMGSGKYDAGALAGCSSGAADLVARLLSVDTGDSLKHLSPTSNTNSHNIVYNIIIRLGCIAQF